MTNGNILEANGKAKPEVREKRREIALRNLKAENLSNLAVAYITQTEQSGFGGVDNESVEEFLYAPSLKKADAHDLESGKEFSIVYDSLRGSRKEGRRYSGQVSEYGIIETAAAITKESLESIKVEDLIGLLGSKLNVKTAYQGKYLSDLTEKIGEKGREQELGKTLISGYLTHLTTQGVSKALGLRANELRSGLEMLVGEEQKK